MVGEEFGSDVHPEVLGNESPDHAMIELLRRPYEAWSIDQSLSKSENNVYNYVKLFNHVGRKLRACGPPGTVFEDEFRAHDVTYLKLLLATSYARAFLRVGSKHADKLYYLDVLSASGVSYTRTFEDIPVPSSAFTVPLAYHDFKAEPAPPKFAFDRVWTFDRDAVSLAAINERRLALGRAGFSLPPYEPMAGDANARVFEAIEAIRTGGAHRPLTLAFIDNVGLDVKMTTIQGIQRGIRADLIVHLPVSAVIRCVEQWRKRQFNQPALTAFFGNEEWQKIDSAADVVSVYHESVRKVTGSEFQDALPVRIKGPNAEFALCFYVRRTRGSGAEGWVSNIQKLAEACNSVSYDRIRGIVERAEGRRTVLHDFF